MPYDALLLDSLVHFFLERQWRRTFSHLRILRYAHDIVLFLLQAIPPRMMFTCHGATWLHAGSPSFVLRRVPTELFGDAI